MQTPAIKSVEIKKIYAADQAMDYHVFHWMSKALATYVNDLKVFLDAHIAELDCAISPEFFLSYDIRRVLKELE